MKDELNAALDPAIAQNRPYQYVKRVLDVCLAVIGTLAMAPVMLLTALIIKRDSPGPAIYRQERVGAGGKLFMMYKFRTMEVGTPVLSTEDMQQQQAIPYTRVGPFIRKTSLDELPQLFNVIRGDMSFVGPRPALPSQEDVNSLRSKYGVDILLPGITGLAQVMGRDDLDSQTKVYYDHKYAERLSLWTDIRIVVMTANAVFSAKGNR